MLSDISSVGFKVTNFNQDNMKILEANWRRVAEALRLTVRLVADFGFSERSLGADSALLPIAYHIYQRRPGLGYLTRDADREDRESIRIWLIRSLVKSGVWGSGLDTLLTALRSAIRENGQDGFPAVKLEAVMRQRGKSLRFEPEELDDLADTTYGDRRSFALLSLLYPYVDLRHEFHVDHVFPKSRFTGPKLSKAGVPGESHWQFRHKSNGLANLQLLDGPLNMSKKDRLPHEWMARHFGDKSQTDAYAARADLGEVPDDICRFEDFYDARRRRIRRRLAELLGVEELASGTHSAESAG
jgi:hypothetical protein